MNRRIPALLGVLTLTAGLVFGVSTAASAVPTPITGTVGDYSYSADSSNVAAGATVTGYTGGPTAAIPATVTLGSSVYAVTSIGNQAFNQDTLTSVTIPDSVISIGNKAFYFNPGLASISLGDSVTSIGGAAFDRDAVTSVTIPDSVTSIGGFAFAQNLLTSVVIPDSVTSIGIEAFYDNPGLASVALGDSVTSLGNYAFADDGLTSVTIPASVTTLGAYAFGDNPGLVTVVFPGAAPTTIGAALVGDSLGDATGLTVYYNWAYDAAQMPGGFITPVWQGYNTVEQATVSFTLNGHGAPIASQTVTVGSDATQPVDPTAVGFIFDGWYTTSALSTRADFTAPITSNTTFYAGWGAPLAFTGVSINPATLPLTGAALLVGVALILIARRRKHSTLKAPRGW